MTDQNSTNTTADNNGEDLNSQMETLLAETEKLKEEAGNLRRKTASEISEIGKRSDASVASAEKLSAELDEIEKETEDELDQLILEQAEDLASEE